MKTIGVLGGLGPQATMDFEARIHGVSQRLIPPLMSGGYPPMVVYYYRFPPMALGKDQRPAMPLRPDPRLLTAAGRLGAWADFLVIPANLPHLLREPIQQAAGRPLLDMIELTMAEVDRRGLKTVGVVGFGEPAVYLRPLRAREIAAVILPDEARNSLDSAIIALMEGCARQGEQDMARAAVECLRGRQVDAIILGCSEIPLLLGADATAPDLINPLQLLAEATVKFALDDTTDSWVFRGYSRSGTSISERLKKV